MVTSASDTLETSTDDILATLEEVFLDAINWEVQLEASVELDNFYEAASAAARKELDERKDKIPEDFCTCLLYKEQAFNKMEAQR